MSSSNAFELRELIKQKKGLEKQIKSIYGHTATRRRLGDDPIKSEVYHTLIIELAAVTEKLKAIKRKNTLVRFSSLKPETIPEVPNLTESSSMPLNHSPPPTTTSTPYQFPTVPQTVNTVLISTTTHSPPIYSSTRPLGFTTRHPYTRPTYYSE